MVFQQQHMNMEKGIKRTQLRNLWCGITESLKVHWEGICLNANMNAQRGTQEIRPKEYR